ncbi:ATP-binding protein [Mucilaginibacter myungsuensis]|uniref:histidine kinase n=1 Tax=Mucilaginibacter myungsuensis TaxID=649104 RepID=A0A929L1A7_9SPHI|nr:ATP-binding protein [Mucilaginibacter myungsuensis]MBE9663773.1 PAS domain-containing protein [Mucilaginibacter myungsuensis]MDN3598902.1 ATP-binding protein [Mucilaginibacter myungsuensis]
MSDQIPFLTEKKLLDVLSLYHYGIAIHIGEDAVIQYANDAMIAIWGKEKKDIINKTLEDALPELKGQPFIDMFKQVWNEGLTISGTDTRADLVVNGELQSFYFDFEYRAVKDDTGKVIAILHTATDISERYYSRQREQTLSEEMLAMNEELSASNEELISTNEELVQSQIQQRELYDELAESTARFRAMVQKAPVGICIIRAGDLFVPEVNDAYLELVGRERHELEGRTIWEAIPEAAAYAPIMDGVIETGIRFEAKEHELMLPRNGELTTVFVDFVYEPIAYDGGNQAIMVLGIEVTEKVLARRGIEEMEQRIRLAVEAAEIGTFDLDLESRKMVTSDRFNAIFDFKENVPWRTFASVIHPDDNERRLKAHDDAMKNGKLFYEARVIYHDNSIHWIRVQGNVLYKDDKPYRMLGTVLDITHVQRLNQQKDDFISIASHELKTPITSLKASLQLLDRMKEAPSPVMLPKLIEQANKSVQKVSSLVEDLLNVSRTNDTRLRLNKTTFTIAEMLNNCCNHIRVAGKYDLKVTGDEQLQINADEHAIDQVVVNLVNNAVKYAPDSLEIILNVERSGNFAKISVSDKGPGIPPEKIPHLFDRYYQGESAGFQNSGLGLGLYICSEIIKRHGGQIGVESEVGKGSTFWFTVPVE